ncbi:PD-(D/E)XK nuclease family protein [Halobacterium wangiae]|uniref:PD-(D/E)XK nuclease family protein n=1 Tax=Halobacterium wangiae TaxID=2902623 RepID=UPI001E2A9A2C|nr:PD-(D/E)XK nuclease family protein [Halobacterium wangiae]
MSFQLAKPIDTLYEDVADYDLVVVPDAPLASALNRRLHRPHLGSFAMTPRRLAAGRREEAEDRLAFLELVKHTELDWKAAAYAIGNILQCWEHQASADSILDYDDYAGKTTQQAVQTIRELDITSRAITDFEINTDQDVAVVGYDQLTALERSILPADYDTYSPFTTDAFDHPDFHIFESANEIINTVLDTVTAENADDIAIVLDSASEYSPLIESGLEAADIPFYGGPGFADHPDHRAFLRLLRTAHAGTDTCVEEVRSVLTRLDCAPGIEHDEKRLHDLDHDAVSWVVEFCTSITDYTFAEALGAFETEADCELESFQDELDALGIAEDQVTEAGVDRLEFYLQTYEVPVDRENEGVLLADAKSAAYVDRPLVFHLGLDEGWTHSAPQRPWVDEDAQYTRNIQQFQLLLQSGATQYYLVQDAKGGSPVTPCLYFEELLEENFDQFSDLDAVHHTTSRSQSENGFNRETRDVEPTTVRTVSQSSLSTYVNSPRDHFFSRLVDSPDKEYFRQGNLFHDFAEYYVNHPDAVNEDTIEATVDLMIEETRPFTRSVDEPTRRTRYRFGLETITEYLDEALPENDSFLTATSGWGTNTVAEHFGRPVDSSFTERWFENHDLGLKGKIDLVSGPTSLVDHKSSSRKRAAQVVNGAAIDPPSDRPNFQALAYLAHWRSTNPGEELTFTFFHFLEPLDDAVTSEAAIEDALTTVTYYPKSFATFAQSRQAYDRLIEEGANNCQKTFSKATYEDYRGVFESAPFPDTTDKSALLDSVFADCLINEMQSVVGEYKYVTSGCEQALRQLARTAGRNFFKDEVDAFEEFVNERISEMNRRRAGEERFPVDGLGGEPNYRYVDNRDLLLEGRHD